MSLLALLPAHNEASRIGPVIAGVLRYLPALVVDDGSTDQTAEVATQAGADVIRQSPNRGKGAALRLGFRRALELGCDAVVMLDSDGQHHPDDLPAFLSCWEATHADLIVGERDFSKMPFIRRLANTLGREVYSAALGKRVSDNQSGYRLLSRRMMEAMLLSTEQGFEFEVEMVTTCVLLRYTLAGVPIRTIYANETSHIKPGKHTAKFLRQVWHTTIRRIQGVNQ